MTSESASRFPVAVPGKLPTPRRVLRVGEISRYVKRLIEDDRLLADISIAGEVTNLSQASSGHIYFSLKDSAGVLKCVLWRVEAQQIAQDLQGLKDGVSVVADGRLTTYEAQSTYQLHVQGIRVQGAGAEQQRVERLRRTLEAEGLFDQSRKRPIPRNPKVLALITSPESRAYSDVIARLRMQWPLVKVILAGASVQGDSCPEEIVLALDIINRSTAADTVLLVRGGGSPEELSGFNDERVARAVFASRVPVITGIGHELDHTIVELVADHRAATPTAAATAAVPDGPAIRAQNRSLQGAMVKGLRAHIARHRQTMSSLERAMVRDSPTQRVRSRRQRVDELYERLEQGMTRELSARRRHLQALKTQISALDPTSVLKRGYALLTDDESGEVIASVDQVRAGQRMEARVRDGSFRAVVDGRA
ncbi:MAG TPA: exodeoxyribonuclease VII large subunit [Chloroflexota bacterium]|nr:exodeoxyribonuclease VII large subunit [Chloroflexota bacterium]